MIKIYKQNNQWFGEVTELNLMTSTDDAERTIDKLCAIQRHFLIESYRKGKLENILNDQRAET